MHEARRLIQTRRCAFVRLAERVADCERCPRLREHCRNIAAVKRRAFRGQTYWGRPLPGFGDPRARLLVIGLAPAAHGANRTGRMFTGDSSGSWLYEALHRYGWSNLPDTEGLGDGLRLDGAYLSAAARCAPPANKPTREEIGNCRPFLLEELDLLGRLELVLCLGRIAFDAYCKALAERGTPWPGRRPEFRHNAIHRPPAPGVLPLMTSYHPSRQNTNTGRLTRAMWHDVFRRCREFLGPG